MWIEPIFNRHINSTLESTDLNRIEGNTSYLADEFAIGIATKNWTVYDFPMASELSRICANIQLLENAYYKPPTAPNLPTAPYLYFSKINDIEYILMLIYEMYTKNKNSRNYTGEIYSGDGIGVI